MICDDTLFGTCMLEIDTHVDGTRRTAFTFAYDTTSHGYVVDGASLCMMCCVGRASTVICESER